MTGFYIELRHFISCLFTAVGKYKICMAMVEKNYTNSERNTVKKKIVWKN